jgi:ABC-type protease/lipase transport system fused ATPase/permease subunit
MLIRTLIIHTLIPVVGLLIPFFVIPFLFNCYVAKLQILNVLSICLSTVFNNISTIYTIKPYRDAIIRCFSTKSWHDKVKRNSKMFRSMEVTTDCESALYIEAKEKASDKSSKSDQDESHAV